MIRHLLKRLVAPLTAALLLASCGGGGDDSPPSDAIYGKASLASGLDGATLEVRDLDGKRPQSLGETTQSSGTFYGRVPTDRVKAFRLVARGGMYAGSTFQGELVADFEGSDPTRDLFYANAVTTLASRMRDRHPEMTVSAASERAKQFLGIPQTSAIGFDVSNPKQTYFDPGKLLHEANAAGLSFGAYLDRLIDEMDRGVLQHKFAANVVADKAQATGERVQAKALDADAASKLFKKAALGFASKLGDELFSWAFESILTALGWSTNSEILDQLHEINAKLDEITAEVSEVIKLGNEIIVEDKKNAMEPEISKIRMQHQWLTHHANVKFPCSVDLVTNKIVDLACADKYNGFLKDLNQRITNILDTDVGIVFSVQFLRDILVGSDSLIPALTTIDNLNQLDNPFRSSKPHPKIVALGAYYEGIQLMATQVLIEAYMANKDSISAKDALALYSPGVAAQEALIATLHAPVPPSNDGTLTMLDTRTGLTWQQSPLSLLWNDGVQNLYYKAANYCESQGQQTRGGYTRWRLPTDPELHAVVQDSPNKTGNADGGAGIIGWLVSKGFAQATSFNVEVNGFVNYGAYISSTISGVTGDYHEALSDTGVDYFFTVGGNQNHNGGAWCVTDESQPAAKRH